MWYVGIWQIMICSTIQSLNWLFFSFACDDGSRGRSFSKGRGGAGLGPAKGLIFGGLHVLLFHSSLAHRKSGRRDLEELGGHPLMVALLETQSLRDSSAGCAMSVWLIWLIRLFLHMDLCIPSYSNLSTCLGCCLRLVHCNLHFIFPILTATNPSRPPNLKGIKARHLGPSIGWKENKSSPLPPFQSVQHTKKPCTLPFYFLSCKCFNSAILLALCTSSFPPYMILPKQVQYELYNFQNCWNWQTIFIQRKIKSVLICTRIIFYMKSSKNKISTLRCWTCHDT
jgi:hypothetical protein